MVIVIRIRREKIITQPGKSKVPPYCECYLQIWFPHFKKWYSRTGKVQRRAMRMTESTEDFPNKEHLKNTLLSGKDEIWEAHDTSPQNHLWTEETSTDGLLFCHTQCKNQRASNEPDRNQMQNRQKGLLFTQQKTNLCESLPGTLHNWHGFTGRLGKVSCAERQTGGYHTNYMFKSETKIVAVWETSRVYILHAYSAFTLS